MKLAMCMKTVIKSHETAKNKNKSSVGNMFFVEWRAYMMCGGKLTWLFASWLSVHFRKAWMAESHKTQTLRGFPSPSIEKGAGFLSNRSSSRETEKDIRR